jgi:hypothetical protein
VLCDKLFVPFVLRRHRTWYGDCFNSLADLNSLDHGVEMKICRALVPTLAMLCLACSDKSARTVGHVVRDSAGIRVVENASPTWNAESAWRLGDVPTLDIGGSDVDPNYELYRVRGALGMPDGRLVIANAGTLELRFYSASGAYLTASGREGEGPGEFQYFSWIARTRGDSLAVFDRRMSRLSVIDSDGRFARNVTIRSVGEMVVQMAGVFGDGSILSYGSPIRGSMGSFRTEDYLFHHERDGALIDTIGIFPGREAFVRDLDPGPVMNGSPYFFRSSTYLAGNEQLYVATNDTYEIGIYSREGDLVSLIRRRFTHLEVTEEAVQLVRERSVSARTPHPMRPQLEEFADAKPIPETMPAYAAVKLDESGNLWVEEYRYPDDAVSRWTVFDVGGVMLGTIRMPSGFLLLYAGESFVLGSTHDELDLERIQRYALIKP